MDARRGQAKQAARLFAEAIAIMERLRAPGGCPWDREQTFASIQPHTLEETYEVLDAIDRRHWPDLCEELGDMLLQVLFYAEMAAEAGHFGIAEVVAGLNAKLVRRHPHVFSKTEVAKTGAAMAVAREPGLDPESEPAPQAIDSAQVLRNWEAIKREEKANRARLAEEASASGKAGAPVSALDGILRSQPALMEARKLGSRAQKSGFDWPDAEGLFDKLREETAELREAIEKARSGQQSDRSGAAAQDAGPASGSASSEAIALEIGDLLFTTANLARHLGIDPEFALRGSNAKFRRRFARMEGSAEGPLESLSPSELETLWNKAKAAERAASPVAP